MSTVASTVVTTFICLVFSIYLLSGKDRLIRQCKKLMDTYLGRERTKKALHVLSALNNAFHSYISGQCLEAVILGILCLIGMLIFRFPYGVMVSALVGCTALIPVAGAYIGAIVGAFMIFTVSPLKSLLFLIYLVVLQQLEGNIIYPRVVGQSIGLPGVWVLSAVTIGGGLFGIPGMIVGVPLTAAAYQLLREDIDRDVARYREICEKNRERINRRWHNESGNTPASSGNTPEYRGIPAYTYTTQSNTTQPNTTQSNTTQPNTTQSNTAQPNAAQAKAASPSGTQTKGDVNAHADPRFTGCTLL